MKWFIKIIIVLFFLLGLYWLFAQYYKPKGHYHLNTNTSSIDKYFIAKFENDTLYTLYENGEGYKPYGWLLPFQRKLIIYHCLEIEYAYFYDKDTLKLRYLDGETDSKITYFGWKPEEDNCNKLKHYLGSCNVRVDLPFINDSVESYKMNGFYKGVQIGIPKDTENNSDSIRIVVDKFHWFVRDSIKNAYEYLQLFENETQSQTRALFVYADKNVRIKDVKKYLLQTPFDKLRSWAFVFQSEESPDGLFLKNLQLEKMDWEQIDDNELLTEYVLKQ